MKIFIEPPEGLSRAMYRVRDGLTENCPHTIVTLEEDADFVLLHVIGFPETVEAIERITARGQKYGMIQYCLRTTQEPDSSKWVYMWRDAEVVWSYYDLPALARADGHSLVDVNFYHAPLGVDASIFRLYDVPRKYEICTSGYVPETESVYEVEAAVNIVDGRMFHLGPADNFNFTDSVTAKHDLHDHDVAQFYSRSKFVSGLRRIEGFELPAAEGLLCGARPIMFDRPHYRKWFSEFAEFIPEGTDAEIVNALTQLFRQGPRRVTSLERSQAADLFDWGRITKGLWAKLRAAPGNLVARVDVRARKRLLWVGDAACSSGFARCTHKTLETVCRTFDVAVLGLNYIGDPHEYPYPIYSFLSRGNPGDGMGVKRLVPLMESFQPDVVVIQNDPWNIPAYMAEVKKRAITTPIVGAIAVDGLNCRGTALKDLTAAIFWTDFGAQQAKLGGYNGPSFVIPLGVDLEIYKPMDRALARKLLSIPEKDKHGRNVHDGFWLTCVNRNQPRKRLDLLIEVFAKWVHGYKIDDAYLNLHVAPTGDVGYDIEQLMYFYGVADRLILATPEIGNGVDERVVAATYAAGDLGVTCTQGEGFGLGTIEGMACGIPQIVPDWSGLGDWANGGAELIRCPSYACTPNGINVVGGVVDVDAMVEAIDLRYRNDHLRESLAQRGLIHAGQPRFRWENIGADFTKVLDHVTSDSYGREGNADEAPTNRVASFA